MHGEGPALAPVNVEEIKGSKKTGGRRREERRGFGGEIEQKKKRKKEGEIGLQITACKTGKLQIALALSIREFIR